MLPMFLTGFALIGVAQRTPIDSQCAKHAQKIPSDEMMRLAVEKAPLIPPLMERLSIHGTVTLEVCVNTRGRVFSATVVEGHPMAYQAALDAVRKWRFRPYKSDGHSADVVGYLRMEYDFRASTQRRNARQ